MSEEDVEEILWRIFLEQKEPLKKSAIDGCAVLPSYNTFIRHYTIRLHTINRKFSERLYYEEPKTCKQCGKVILYKDRANQFCSQSCAAIYNNSGRIRVRKDEEFLLSGAKANKYLLERNEEGLAVVATNCLCCGMEIAQLSRGSRKYCSLKCAGDYRYITSFIDWYNGDYSPKSSVIRNHLTTMYGYSCSCCGISEWNGKPITLEVEHISGISSDNSKENVCLLCPNCHSQTPTYKAKNKGNGRAARRLRYQQGKSY